MPLAPPTTQWMGEREAARVKGLTLEVSQGLRHGGGEIWCAMAGTVDGVTSHRMAHVMHVDPYLMRAARLEADTQSREVGVARSNREVRDGMPALDVYRHAGAMRSVPGDRSIDTSALGAQATADHCIVFSFHRPAKEFRHEMAVRTGASGHDEKPRRVLVQAMHHARPRQPGEFRIPVQQAVGKGVSAVSRSRMHDQPGRLVDHYDFRVFVDRPDWDGVRLPVAIGRSRHGHLDPFPSCDPHRGIGRAAVDEYVAFQD